MTNRKVTRRDIIILIVLAVLAFVIGGLRQMAKDKLAERDRTVNEQDVAAAAYQGGLADTCPYHSMPSIEDIGRHPDFIEASALDELVVGGTYETFNTNGYYNAGIVASEPFVFVHEVIERCTWAIAVSDQHGNIANMDGWMGLADMGLIPYRPGSWNDLNYTVFSDGPNA